MIKLNIIFSPLAWQEYTNWQIEDKKTLKRINKLINDIQRHPFEGIGKPEPLTYELSGAWSRRIDTVNRIVYTVTSTAINIVQVKYHY
ncbi:MAG TPA: Txe/YoeB family addiction module toxin [Lactobacillus sp.]|nr:Txe/YoeB family addiction module toxin [Lactobacillus sp.]